MISFRRLCSCKERAVLKWDVAEFCFDGFAFTLFGSGHAERHAAANVGLIFRLALDQSGIEAFAEGGLACCSSARERVQYGPAFRRYEAAEPLHQIYGLYCRVLGAETIVCVGFCGVEETGGGAGVTTALSRKRGKVRATSIGVATVR